MLTFDLPLPYEFFWEYTRQDLGSYTFRGSNLIRIRSVFSEPQHLGLFLNTLLTIFYFNNMEYKMIKGSNLLITLCSVLTFSFATLPTLILIKILYIYKKYGIGYFFSSKFIYATILCLAFISIFYDSINQTIVVRLFDISSGVDGSATNRLIESWSHVNNIFIGNGIGNTPYIWNNYAYVLSDLGLFPFLLIVILSLYFVYKNKYLGVLFIIFNFQRGGYLSAYYWTVVLIFILYTVKNSKKSKDYFVFKENVTN